MSGKCIVCFVSARLLHLSFLCVTVIHLWLYDFLLSYSVLCFALVDISFILYWYWWLVLLFLSCSFEFVVHGLCQWFMYKSTMLVVILISGVNFKALWLVYSSWFVLGLECFGVWSLLLSLFEKCQNKCRYGYNISFRISEKYLLYYYTLQATSA